MSIDFEVFPEAGATVNTEDLSLREQRALIFMILYAAHAQDYEASTESVVENIDRGFGVTIAPDSRVFQWAAAIIKERDALDGQLKPLLAHWRLERIGLPTRLILRMALWELQYVDTPSTIVINEAVELAKCFAELEAYKFINGVLDEFVKKQGKDKDE